LLVTRPATSLVIFSAYFCRGTVEPTFAQPVALGSRGMGTAALFEGILSTGIKSRFAELRLPKGAPRLWTWSVIGGAFYVLFFLLLRSVLARPFIPFWTPVTLILTALLLLVNASWNWIFFRKKDLWLSFCLFCALPLIGFHSRGSSAPNARPALNLVCALPGLSDICNMVGSTVFGDSIVDRSKRTIVLVLST
jgi:TspO/MBR family protein